MTGARKKARITNGCEVDERGPTPDGLPQDTKIGLHSRDKFTTLTFSFQQRDLKPSKLVI